jgi:hypothetical protein
LAEITVTTPFHFFTQMIKVYPYNYPPGSIPREKIHQAIIELWAEKAARGEGPAVDHPRKPIGKQTVLRKSASAKTSRKAPAIKVAKAR